MSLTRLWIGLAALSLWGADGNLERTLQQVETRYNQAKTLQVHFQEQYTAPGRPSRTEQGTLSLRKPGRMRWDYSQPAGKLFISDGKWLWLYTPAEKRAEKMKLKESEDMRAPLAFLLGRLKFEKEFRNLRASSDGDAIRIVAEPKTDNLPYSSVEFVVAPGGVIREVKVTGFDRSILDFTFADEKMNPPLDPGLFSFTPPPGTAVVADEGA